MQDAPTDQKADSSDKAEAPPVWHRPAWITAMVGLVSAFLTIPDVVGDYLAKEQEIEATRIENEGSVQGQALELVQNTLSQQGDERIFMLRFFAATLQDPQAKAWAEGEVARLDELARLQGELDRQRLAIDTKEAEIALLREEGAETEALQSEISTLQAAISQKDLEVAELRAQAGVERQAPGSDILHLSVSLSETEAGDQTYSFQFQIPALNRSVNFPGLGCTVSHDNPCEKFLASRLLPSRITILGLVAPFALRARVLRVNPEATNGVSRLPLVYTCGPPGPSVHCDIERITTPMAQIGIRG